MFTNVIVDQNPGFEFSLMRQIYLGAKTAGGESRLSWSQASRKCSSRGEYNGIPKLSPESRVFM